MVFLQVLICKKIKLIIFWLGMLAKPFNVYIENKNMKVNTLVQQLLHFISYGLVEIAHRVMAVIFQNWWRSAYVNRLGCYAVFHKVSSTANKEEIQYNLHYLVWEENTRCQ